MTMEHITQQFFPAIGAKSPSIDFSAHFLRRAYYTANIFVFLIIVLVLGYIRFQQFQYQRKFELFGPGLGKNVINITYAQLGPPPSIIDNEITLSNQTGITAGEPKPLPDTFAQQENGFAIENITNPNITNKLIAVTIPVVSFLSVDVKPQPVEIPEPTFPPSLQKNQIEGQVIVKALVDIDGKIIDAQVTRSSDNNFLDQAALTAAMKARFTPAKQHEQFVRVWVSIPYNFHLTDRK